MVALVLTLAATALLAFWRSSLDGIGLFESRLSLVVAGICVVLLALQLLEVLGRYQEERHYRRWLSSAE